MRLFNKTIDRQLFKQYSLGSDLSKQEVVAKIFNPVANGRWYILNSDPQDPDYLWAIVDLGYGAEVGSVSRSDLETYRGRFGLGFERDLSFDPVNAEELYQGLLNGEYYADGGEMKGKDTWQNIFEEFGFKKGRSKYGLNMYYKRGYIASVDHELRNVDLMFEDDVLYRGFSVQGLLNALENQFGKRSFADGGDIEVVYERRADFKKKPIKLLLLSRGKEQKGYTFSGKDQVAVLDNYNRNKQEDLEKLWNLKGYESKYADGGEVKDLIRERNELLNDMYNNEDTKVESSDIIKVGDVLYGDDVNGYVRIFKEVNDPLKGDYFILQDRFDDKFAFYITKIIRDLYKKDLKIQNVNVSEKDFLYSNEVVNIKKELEFHKGRVNLYKKNPNDASNYSGISYSDFVGSESKIKKLEEDLKLYLKDEKHNFADGGELVDYSDNQLMIMNQNVEVEHHHEELEDILEDKVPVPAWVVAKMETATQNLSDITHYLDGQKELMEEENEDENEEEYEEQEAIENKEVVEPINVSAGTKTELTKKFTDDALGNLRGFLKGMEGIDLRDDYTFDYKDEQFEVEPIINSDENGVSNAVFTIFDGDGEEVGDVAYSRDGGKQKFTANSEFFSWNNAKFEDGGYFDGTIPKVSTYMSTYAKGGEVAKAEILGLSKNIMGTTDIEMKISGMRKSQDFIVYPISKDDTDKIITIQSSTRIGKIDLSTGRGLMSQSHSNGAYFVHFQMDKLTPFTVSESDLEDIKAHIFRTAGSNVGTRGIVSDNSGASRLFADGGEVYSHKHSKGWGEDITIELLEPTAKGWKVKQTTKKGRKTSTKTAFLSKQEISELFEKQYAHGGETEEGVDLFEDYENIPPKLQAILDKYQDAFEDGEYSGLAKALKEANKIGYTFEYYLDGQAYDLRKIGEKGKSEVEDYAKGGKIKLGDIVEVKEPNFGYDSNYYVVDNKAGYDQDGFLISETRKRESSVFEEDQLKKLYAKGGMVVSSIKDIPNFTERLEQGKITYRGLGMGKLYDTFYDLAGTSGKRIKVDGKEYYITDKEFDTFSRGADGKLRVKFDAPFRRGYADGGFMNDVYAEGGKLNFKDRSERDSLKLANAYQKVLDSNFDETEYNKYIKIVKETQIPNEELQKIELYITTTPKGQRRMIDTYRYWGKNQFEDGGFMNDVYAKGGSVKKDWWHTVVNPNEDFNNFDDKMPIDWDVDDFKSWVVSNADIDGNVDKEVLDVVKMPKSKLTVEYLNKNGSGKNNNEYYKEFGNWQSALYDIFTQMKKDYLFKKSLKYVLKADIKTVTVKTKNGKEVTYSGADVLNGNYVLAKGGDITSKATYFGKNNVVGVELKDGTTIKPANGYWVKKGAEPISNDSTPTTSGSSEPKIGTTEIRKDMRGNWRAETNIDNFNGYDWRLSTVKTYSGNLVSSAQGGKTEPTGTKGIKMFSYAMYQDPNHTLEVSKPKRLTDKVVSEQHEKALAKFKKFMETGMFKGGGKISNFDKLSAKVAKEYEGKPVKSQYQEEYGKYYSKEEAQEVGDKVAGKVKAMQTDSKAFGGLFGGAKSVMTRNKYPDLDDKQVGLKSGKFVQVFAQSDNKLSVLDVGRIGSGERPYSIDISEVDSSYLMQGGQTSSKKANSGTEMLKQANELAKKIRKDGESWLDAKKRAFAQLKK